MNSRLLSLLVVSAALSLAGCGKAPPPAAAAPVTSDSDNQLAEARDALQRQALEIETKTALMDLQFAEMEQTLKDHENAALRASLDALRQQNEALRSKADAARQQSDALAQRIATAPQPGVAAQPMAQPDYSMFYESLAPYGRWLDVNGYGYCWLPTITVMGWRPYVDGCWVWSSLGWAWQSNEPFGWATYHYGRWLNLLGYGWVWVPGSEWAPAWVAWRQSLDCVGWAPLPPEPGVCTGVYRDCDSRYGLGPASYTFITTNQFVSPTYINVYAPVTRQTTIFQRSVNVTQIVPRHGHGHSFVSQGGPPRAQMELACGHPVPQRQVQAMHAGQMSALQQHHGRRDADAPMAMVDLPAMAPGAHMRGPNVKEHIQRPVRTSGFDGVPQRVATEIRETLAREKETAVVQQPAAHGHRPNQPGRHPGEAPAVVNGTPRMPNVRPRETASSAGAPENQAPAQVLAPAEKPAGQHRPGQGSMPHRFPRHSVEAPAAPGRPSVTDAPAQETVRPAVAVGPASGAIRESGNRERPAKGTHRTPETPSGSKVVEGSIPAMAPAAPTDVPAMVENKAAEQAAAAVVPVSEPERTAPAAVTAPPAVMTQPPAASSAAQQPVAAEKMALDQATAAASAEAARAQMHAARERARAAAMQQRERQGGLDRGMAGKRAAEQAAANAETEKNRQQAEAAAMQQKQELAAQQQRMAADQAAAAETEKARQQAEAAAMQQQQELAAQQQRAMAERMATEQAAAAEAARVKQQTEAAAMQRQQEAEMQRAQEQARRTAEEQQMRVQQETERRAQEMEQREAEAAARRQQEAEMQRAQEQARRAAEEQQMRAQQETERRAQEMAQRQAEAAARRQQEAEMQRAQEQARRAAEEQQMRAQQEAAQRAAQEMAQRQQEEAARRQQEEAARRQQEEAARRQQEEAARRQQEAEMQRAQEQAQRQAEEQARRVAEQQMRAQQEAEQRAQEMARRAQEQAQRQAEEQARRAQEAAQRAAAEAAQRAAAEAARNQPQPGS